MSQEVIWVSNIEKMMDFPRCLREHFEVIWILGHQNHWIFHHIFTIGPGYSVRCFSHIFSHLEGEKELIDYNHLHIWNFGISYAWHIQIKHISTIAGRHIGLRFFFFFLVSDFIGPFPFLSILHMPEIVILLKRDFFIAVALSVKGSEWKGT